MQRLQQSQRVSMLVWLCAWLLGVAACSPVLGRDDGSVNDSGNNSSDVASDINNNGMDAQQQDGAPSDTPNGADGSMGMDAPRTDGSNLDVPTDGPVLVGNMIMCGGHVCQCSNGIDDDNDGVIDVFDPECVSPFDDDESSFATGIPGDNMGSMAAVECFFDGNSGTGNDSNCVVPNGCDCRGCCDFDINRNGTRERVNIREVSCHVVQQVRTANVEGGPCTPGTDGGMGSCTGAGQQCIRDGSGAYFCAPCSPCRLANEEVPPLTNCTVNTCQPGEVCIGDPPPVRPDGGVSTDSSTTNDASGTDAGTPAQCEQGVRACFQHSDCAVQGEFWYCITGCCRFLG